MSRLDYKTRVLETNVITSSRRDSEATYHNNLYTSHVDLLVSYREETSGNHCPDVSLVLPYSKDWTDCRVHHAPGIFGHALDP
jgi:hypothetical protein